MKVLIAAIVFAFIGFAPVMVKAETATSTTTQTSTPTEPAKVTTVVEGGTIAATIIQYMQIAFGGAIATLTTALIYKAFGWMGIQINQQQRDQLQSIVVNGVNDAAAKAEVSLRGDHRLDIDVKNQVIADAVEYTQHHGADTIKALGLDPNSGQAVEAIRARIATALNDPLTPTPPAITPKSAGGEVS